MSAESASIQEWGTVLHPTYCSHCHAAFLVPANAGAPQCPNCFAARLEPIPALAQDKPPELIVPFSVAPATLNANLERWLRDIPFKSATLNVNALQTRLTPIFLPVYLADASVWGSWNAQMGFDYLVASSEERYNGGQWVTQRLNETRIRWEPRAGDISRKYENVPTPALEQHALLFKQLGEGRAAAFDTTRAIPYTAQTLANAFVRAPEITNDAATTFTQKELERRAAADCQLASNAQHHEQFVLRAAFGEPHWTLLLLPTYVTSYSDDNGHWLAVRVNGQTGFVSGTKHASMKQARRWTFVLAGIALLLFLFSALVALTSLFVSQVQTIAGILLLVTFVAGLVAPVPLIIAWQYNRQQNE